MSFSPSLAGVVDEVLRANGTSAYDAELWRTVARLDWPLVGVAEDRGGAGGSLIDVAEIAAGVGRHAAVLPLWQTATAAWALAEAGLPLDGVTDGAVAVLCRQGQFQLEVVDGATTVSGGLCDVTWLPVVRIVVALVAGEHGTAVLRLEPAPDELVETGRTTLAGEPLGDLKVAGRRVGDASVGHLPADFPARVETRTALLRAAALYGAIETACALTRTHVSTRHQFGRPLVAHQAVAHGLASMAAERDRLRAAVAEALDRFGPDTVAAARTLAAATAGPVSATAHQLHGAIGVTQEHPLHRFTSRLWAWRDADGSTRGWAERLGSAVLTGGADDALWGVVTGADS